MPLCRFSYCNFAQWTAGASRRPVFPAPSFSRGQGDEEQSSGENKPRGCEGVSTKKARAEGATVLPRNAVIASAAKQSRVFPRWDSGLLRCARNDDVEAGVPENSVSCPGRSVALLQRCAAEPGPMLQRWLWLPGSRLCAATRRGVAARPGHGRKALTDTASALLWPGRRPRPRSGCA